MTEGKEIESLASSEEPSEPVVLKHPCNLCKYQTDDQNELTIHLRKIHFSSQIKEVLGDVCSTAQCPQCGYLTGKEQMKAHMQIHDSGEFFNCDQCLFKAGSQGEVDEHVQQKHKVKLAPTQICKMCNMRFWNAEDLKQHTEMHLKDTTISVKNPFLCNMCPLKLMNRRDALRHLQLHTDRYPFKCRHCVFSCFTKASIQRHLSIHRHASKPKSLTAIRKNGRKSHSVGASGSSGSESDVQKSQRKSQSSKSSTFGPTPGTNGQTVPGATGVDPADLPFTCELCGKSFRMKVQLCGHMKTHGRVGHSPIKITPLAMKGKYTLRKSRKPDFRLSDEWILDMDDERMAFENSMALQQLPPRQGMVEQSNKMKGSPDASMYNAPMYGAKPGASTMFGSKKIIPGLAEHTDQYRMPMSSPELPMTPPALDLKIPGAPPPPEPSKFITIQMEPVLQQMLHRCLLCHSYFSSQESAVLHCKEVHFKKKPRTSFVDAGQTPAHPLGHNYQMSRAAPEVRPHSAQHPPAVCSVRPQVTPSLGPPVPQHMHCPPPMASQITTRVRSPTPQPVPNVNPPGFERVNVPPTRFPASTGQPPGLPYAGPRPKVAPTSTPTAKTISQTPFNEMLYRAEMLEGQTRYVCNTFDMVETAGDAEFGASMTVMNNYGEELEDKDVGKQQFTCSVCNLKYDSYHQLCQHLKMHVVKKPSFSESLATPDISGAPPSDDNVDKEGSFMESAKHTFARPKVYPCELCGFSFSSFRQFRVHISQTHGGKYQYRLMLQQKEAAKAGAFLKEPDTINKTHPHKCDVCGRRFKRLALLIFHLNKLHKGWKQRFSVS
eukprot:XP_011679133.1 PREDICTED: zinc finger protein 629-like [Strongylocentrotus purpuratus]